MFVLYYITVAVVDSGFCFPSGSEVISDTEGISTLGRLGNDTSCGRSGISAGTTGASRETVWSGAVGTSCGVTTGIGAGAGAAGTGVGSGATAGTAIGVAGTAGAEVTAATG